MSNDRYDDQGNQDLDENFENDYASEFDDTSSSGDDEWDDAEAEDAPDSYAPPKKKKSFSTVIIIGVAVIAGLIFMVFKFGGGSSTEAPATLPTDSVAETVSPAPVDTAAPLQEPPLETVSQDQNVLPPADGAVTAQASDTNVGPLTPMPSESPVDNTVAVPLEAAPIDTPSVPPSAEESSAPPLMTAVPDMASPDTAPPSALTQNEAVPPLMGQKEESSDLSSHDSQPLQPVSDFPSADMIKKVDVAEPASMDQPKIEVSPEPSPELTSVDAKAADEKSLDPSSELSAALEKIKQLEDAAEKNTQVIEEYKGQVSSLKQEVDDLKFKQEDAPQKAKSVKSSDQPPSEKVRSANVAPVKWVLKGAQSGRALLALDGRAQGDVRTVSVGDKVSGLGTILSIEKGQMGWVVLGTLGRVTQ